jgi:hypothetical protein
LKPILQYNEKGAEGGIRTHTVLRPPAPKTGDYANLSTSALVPGRGRVSAQPGSYAHFSSLWAAGPATLTHFLRGVI